MRISASHAILLEGEGLKVNYLWMNTSLMHVLSLMNLNIFISKNP